MQGCRKGARMSSHLTVQAVLPMALTGTPTPGVPGSSGTRSCWLSSPGSPPPKSCRPASEHIWTPPPFIWSPPPPGPGLLTSCPVTTGPSFLSPLAHPLCLTAPAAGDPFNTQSDQGLAPLKASCDPLCTRIKTWAPCPACDGLRGSPGHSSLASARISPAARHLPGSPLFLCRPGRSLVASAQGWLPKQLTTV